MIDPARESLGTVSIQERAIADIVGLAALKVPKVRRLKGNILEECINALYTTFFGQPFPYNGVRILLSDRDVSIRIRVTAEFGADLGETAAIIQDKIRDAVETMSGLAVTEVSVAIVSVERSTA